jgi:small subunit ribosomal protein S20
MPIIKSAKKRVRQMNKAKARNNTVRQTLRASLKTFMLATKNNKNISEAQKQAESALDMAAKKGVIHKNKVARKKRQLATAAKAAGNKPEKSATAKKPAVKKPAAKKPAAKK